MTASAHQLVGADQQPVCGDGAHDGRSSSDGIGNTSDRHDESNDDSLSGFGIAKAGTAQNAVRQFVLVETVHEKFGCVERVHHFCLPQLSKQSDTTGTVGNQIPPSSYESRRCSQNETHQSAFTESSVASNSVCSVHQGTRTERNRDGRFAPKALATHPGTFSNPRFSRAVTAASSSSRVRRDVGEAAFSFDPIKFNAALEKFAADLQGQCKPAAGEVTGGTATIQNGEAS